MMESIHISVPAIVVYVVLVHIHRLVHRDASHVRQERIRFPAVHHSVQIVRLEHILMLEHPYVRIAQQVNIHQRTVREVATAVRLESTALALHNRIVQFVQSVSLLVRLLRHVLLVQLESMR
jgi:hypothetical protein